jgi:hypothetical protein
MSLQTESEIAPAELCAFSCDQLGRQLEDGDERAEAILVSRAYDGDLEAQRVLIDRYGAASAAAHASGEGDGIAAMNNCETFLRLAARHGQAQDLRALATLLAFKAIKVRDAGHFALSKNCEVECLLLLTLLADAGWDEAATAIGIYAPGMYPDSLTIASAEAKRLWAEEKARRAALAASLPCELVGPWSRAAGKLSDIGWAIRVRWWVFTDWLANRLRPGVDRGPSIN